MPNFNGMGPNGAGPMTGRGMGDCGDSPAIARGFALGRGCGRGFRRGYGRGFGGRGMGMGWVSIGNTPGGDEAAATAMRAALEERKISLHAELARTEALLADAGSHASTLDSGEKAK